METPAPTTAVSVQRSPRLRKIGLGLLLLTVMAAMALGMRPKRDPRFVGHWRRPGVNNWMTIRSNGTLEYYTGLPVRDCGTEHYRWWFKGDLFFIEHRPDGPAWRQLATDLRDAALFAVTGVRPFSTPQQVAHIDSKAMTIVYPNGQRVTMTRQIE